MNYLGNTGLTTFAYDENSNLLTITDADANSGGTGKQTIYSYDPRNLRLTEQYPDHVAGSLPGTTGYDIVTHAYDGVHRFRSRVDQKNETMTFAYDSDT